MTIRFFFEYGGIVYQLPVNPETLDISHPGANETIDMVTIGQRNIIKRPQLEQISFGSFLPRNPSPSYVQTKGKFWEPAKYIAMWNKAKADKQPVRFIITGIGVNNLYSIESIDYSMEGGDEDMHFTIELKEYKVFSLTAASHRLPGVNVTAPPGSGSSGSSGRPSGSGGIGNTGGSGNARPGTGIAVGSVVTATGNFYYSSWGTKPSYVFPKGFRGKVDRIVADKNRAYRYHVTTMSGGYRGWVKPEQLKAV